LRALLGTPCWTAPEVLRSEHYTNKADVYSFGIVLWEALTLRDPYEGTPPFQVVFAVGTRGLRPDVPASAPPPLVQLMRACWHEQPAQRPSFSAILNVLLELQATPHLFLN
jgi:serine/threonine protein kinase